MRNIMKYPIRFLILTFLIFMPIYLVRQRIKTPDIYATQIEQGGRRVSTQQDDTTVYLPMVMNAYPAWQQVGNFPSGVEKFYDIAVCNDRFVASANAGVYLLDHNEWVPDLDIPNDVSLRISFDNSSCNVIYVTTLNEGVFRGDWENNDWKWTRIHPAGEIIRAVAVISGTVFIGGDFGVRWSHNPTSELQPWSNTNITTLVTGLTAQPDANESKVLGAVWGTGIFVNDIDNSNWTKIPSPGELLIYEVAKDSSGMIAGTQSGVYVWNGLNWSQAALFSTEATYSTVATEKALYAGQRNDGGVLVSYDGGKTWAFLNTGFDMDAPLGEFQVWGLTVEEDGKLYSATTSGIWSWQGEP